MRLAESTGRRGQVVDGQGASVLLGGRHAVHDFQPGDPVEQGIHVGQEGQPFLVVQKIRDLLARLLAPPGDVLAVRWLVFEQQDEVPGLLVVLGQ